MHPLTLYIPHFNLAVQGGTNTWQKMFFLTSRTTVKLQNVVKSIYLNWERLALVSSTSEALTESLHKLHDA